MQAKFIRLSETGKTAVCTVKGSGFQIGSQPVYLNADPFLEMIPGDTVNLPEGGRLVDMVGPDGKPLLTKDGTPKQTMVW